MDEVEVSRLDIRYLVIPLLILFLALLIGSSMAILSPIVVGSIVAAILLCIITAIKTDWGLIILIFSMLLSPEIPFAAIPGRLVVIRIDDFLLGAVFLTWLAKLAAHRKLGVLRRTPLNLPFALYIFICYLCTFRGILIHEVEYPIKSYFYLLKYTEYFLLYIMVANNIHSKRQVKNFVIAFLITCVIVCLYGYVQMGLHPGTRITTPFEGYPEPNTLGGYLLLLMAITTGLFLYSTSRRLLFWMGLLFLFMIPIFLLTHSRTSYMGFIPMFLVLVVLSRKKKLFMVTLLILMLIFGPLLLPASVKERIKETFIGKEYETFGFTITIARSPAERIESWKEVVRKWTERPLLGYGVTGVGLVDSQYPRVLGEMGIIGSGIFLWLLISLFKGGFRVFRRVKDERAQGLALGFLAGSIGIVTHAIGANTFIIVRIMEPFWFMAAIVMMLPRIEEEKIPVEVEEQE